MTRPTKLKGQIWVLTDPDGQLYGDVDTDMIFHNRYLHITDMGQMGQYALDNLQGWEDFSQKAAPGDIIVAGRNFGAGSSRQQAVDCFQALGIAAVIADRRFAGGGCRDWPSGNERPYLPGPAIFAGPDGHLSGGKSIRLWREIRSLRRYD
jgi:hypothetical protein